MNEIRIKGTLKFAPRTHGENVFIAVVPEGETGSIDMACWASDAPEATAALAKCGEGDKVTVLGKLIRKKDKMLGKLDREGKPIVGDAWVLGVNVLKARVDAAAPKRQAEPPPAHNDEELPF